MRASAPMPLHIYGATALAEGMSIRATGRLLSVDKDTVNHWLPVLGAHCQHILRYFFRHLHGRECQLDELWTFIAKKEARLTSLEKLAAIAGDAWVWIAFSPVDKLVLAWVVGNRILGAARQLVAQLKPATKALFPCFAGYALPHYAEGLLGVGGGGMTPPRRGGCGLFPPPRRCPPPDLC